MFDINKLKTPCFLIRTNKIDELLNELFTSIKGRWNQGIVGYSFKTNNLPWIIEYMKNKGLWAEVVSSDEYELAKELGYDISKIIFNGPVKRKEEFIEAVEGGAIVNIDSKRELEWLTLCNQESLYKANIGLRVNFCIEDFCPGESQGGNDDGRFGFSYEMGELKKAIDFLREKNIKLSGLHLHCSSKTRSINIYEAIGDIATKIVKEYNLKLDYIDIGGGFFGGVPGKPSFDDYMSVIYKRFESDKLLKNTNLVVEPGISVIGSAIDYITSVVDTKETKNNNFVVLDGSRIHIDPLMRKSEYSYEIKRNKNIELNNKEINQIICGFTCMENDRFFKIDDKSLNVNDNIIFKKVGAYTMGLSPQFIEFYPIVYVLNNNRLEIARRKNTAKDFIK